MFLYRLSNSEIREEAKKHIETLEFWLRRVIDNVLTDKYGIQYFNSQDENNSFLIKREIREKVTDRLKKYPERFVRWIDATLLEHLIEIICKEKLYKSLFKPFFAYNYPIGKEQLKFSLTKLSEIRNRLYHSNPISIRQAEQSICYSNDIIESIQKQYIQRNQHMDFNAPSILSVQFSDGTIFYRENMIKSSNGLILNKRSTKYRCGEEIKIEIEIDSSFTESEYDIVWSWKNIPNMLDKSYKSITIKFTENHVGEVFQINAKLISKKTWHRYNQHDDQISIQLTILPPIE